MFKKPKIEIDTNYTVKVNGVLRMKYAKGDYKDFYIYSDYRNREELETELEAITKLLQLTK
jgi:hypothetical protein